MMQGQWAKSICQLWWCCICPSNLPVGVQDGLSCPRYYPYPDSGITPISSSVLLPASPHSKRHHRSNPTPGPMQGGFWFHGVPLSFFSTCTCVSTSTLTQILKLHEWNVSSNMTTIQDIQSKLQYIWYVYRIYSIFTYCLDFMQWRHAYTLISHFVIETPA